MTAGDRAARVFAGPVMTVAGLLHFLRPRMYEAIMPPWLPAHRELVLLSGAAEIASGLGTLHPRTRPAAGWLLVATLAAVFPANVHMARHPERYRVPGGAPALWARLPFQGLFVYWAWRTTQR